MTAPDSDIQQLMIEYVLGTLDDRQRGAFEVRLATEARLERQVAALRRVLKPLDAWQAPEPSSGAVDAIMSRVESTTPLQYVASSTAMPPEPSSTTRGRRSLSLGEILAVAACIALFMGVFIPSMGNLKSQRLQAMCAGNLAGFGQGLSMYADQFDGQLPSMGQAQGVNWLQQPNRRHLEPALQLRFLVPKSLICPAGESLDSEVVAENIRAFLRDKTFGFYSTQNGNGPTPPMIARIRMPLVSDTNPIFENGQVRYVQDGLPNSRVHGGKGQNTLFLDGSTEFLRTPVVQSDNIWRAEDIDEYSGTESQHSATDAFLIP